MDYYEAEKLKKSLRSDRYISKSGHEMKIHIAPEDDEAREAWKHGVKQYWYESGKADDFARYYVKMGGFILFGIRVDEKRRFYGGILDLKEHPELMPIDNPMDSSSFQ